MFADLPQYAHTSTPIHPHNPSPYHMYSTRGPMSRWALASVLHMAIASRHSSHSVYLLHTCR